MVFNIHLSVYGIRKAFYIHTLIQSVYDDSILKDMFTDGHETKVKDNPLNENFAKAEFQALWKQINHKYALFV